MRPWMIVAAVACGPQQPSPTQATSTPAGDHARQRYTIRQMVLSNADLDNTTVVEADVPNAWHARFDDDRGSPAFETSPNVVIAIVDVTTQSAEREQQLRYANATAPEVVQVASDRKWVVAREADGGAHATMFIADGPYVLTCGGLLGPKQAAEKLGLVKDVCASVKIVSSTDAPTTDSNRPHVNAPPPPPPPPTVITPKKKDP